MEIAKMRNEAILQCKAPTRSTCDDDVLDSSEEMARVSAEWAAYFKQVDAILERYPYTEEEKSLHGD